MSATSRWRRSWNSLAKLTIGAWFQARKATVGGKATEIERGLRLRQHSEPGLCRSEFIETFTNIQLGNGMVIPLHMAKQMGLVPPDVTLG